MSGHSKWATIKRQKGANDIKKGKIFTKMSYAITIAVKEGGGVADPESNPRLRLAIDEAKSVNMPKDNIERAIARASGREGSTMTEVVYEGFGPGGFSLIVEGLTDNIQRTISEVKSTFDKNGGRIGNPGSVAYQFEKQGVVVVGKNGKSLDDIFLVAADSGATDVEDAIDEVWVYTSPADLAKTKTLLSENGLFVKTAELSWKPIVLSEISDKEAAGKALSFIEKIENLDDVQKVYINLDISDDLIKELDE